MKTIKTVNGIKRIDDWDVNLIPVQLRSILHDHRKALVDKLVTGGLDLYIDYKFSTKASFQQVERIKLKLTELANSGIDLEVYQPIFDEVMENEFTKLDNARFYYEIDEIIKAVILKSDLFREGGRQVFFKS
jgi:hypothetical protein